MASVTSSKQLEHSLVTVFVLNMLILLLEVSPDGLDFTVPVLASFWKGVLIDAHLDLLTESDIEVPSDSGQPCFVAAVLLTSFSSVDAQDCADWRLSAENTEGGFVEATLSSIESPDDPTVLSLSINPFALPLPLSLERAGTGPGFEVS